MLYFGLKLKTTNDAQESGDGERASLSFLLLWALPKELPERLWKRLDPTWKSKFGNPLIMHVC